MTEEASHFVLFPRFHAWPISRAEDADVEAGADEAERFFDKWSDRVQVRGVYSTAAFKSAPSVLMWWIAPTADDMQELILDYRRTSLAKRLTPVASPFMGVHRPPETAPDHLPAFLRGEPPRKYICVYPFVRTPEWYLLPKEERAALLREHGEIGREFPGVLPNTTSAFGLGDYEWILAFEADDLVELVDCIRRLRDSRSRLYVKEETPFITGIRKELSEVIRDVL